jgi:dephospho-CoA kinase
MIIGIAGTFASGKDSLANYLADNFAFMHVSSGDIVRHIAMAKHGSKSRDVLVVTANELRATGGPGVLIDKAVEMFMAQNDSKNLVISGIRSIGEVEELHKLGGRLLFVDADVRLRYERSRARNRNLEDNLTLQQFIDSEKLEFEQVDNSDKTVQNIGFVKTMADVVICNDNNQQEFNTTATKWLNLEPINE